MIHTHLLLDTGLIYGYRCSNTHIEITHLHKDNVNNPLFSEEFFADVPKPWEVRYDNGYPNIIYDDSQNIFRCYYTLFTYDASSSQTPLYKRPEVDYSPLGSRITSLCYAESIDGIHWHKPCLGLVEFEGSYDNNILLRYAHGTGVLYDRQEIDPTRRYKLVTKVEYSSNRHYMAVAFSSDGIHFSTLQSWPQHNPAADAHNFPYRDPFTNCYKLTTRIWKNGLRICAVSHSNDFLNWSAPCEVLRGDGFSDEIYSMTVFPYHNLLLGLASVYHNGDELDENHDTVDVELKVSTSSDSWNAVDKGNPIIPRGNGHYPSGDFDCGCIYATVPIEVDNKLWVYYMGGNGQHTNFRETALARGYFEKDKFAGFVQKRSDVVGQIVTNHFEVYGNTLSILADVQADGWVLVAIGNKNGSIYQGYEATNCQLLPQPDGYRLVDFGSHRISDLRQKPVSLTITFVKAKIYAIRGELEHYDLKY